MTMRMILIAGIILIFFCSAAMAQAPLIEDPTRGARLFVSKGCERCHALKGEGGKVGPDLGRIDLGETQFGFAAKLINHIPTMRLLMEKPRFVKPNLTGEELTEISAYLYLLRFFDEPGDSGLGKYLFAEKGCKSCHPLSGKGKEGAPGLNEFPQNISPIFLSQSIWNHGPVMIAQMARLGIPWPEFRNTEMMDLLEYLRANAKGGREIAYIAPGNPRNGLRLFVAKGCVQCHAIRGEGGKAGGDLGKKAKAFYKSLTQIASSMWNKGPTVLGKMAETPSGIPKFTPKEMADLITYLYFLHFTDEPGNPAKGRKIFLDLGCSQCHSLAGKPGDWMNIDLSKYQKVANPMEIAAGIWNHGAEIEGAMREKGFSWPRFKPGEMAHLLEFVRNPEKK